jgi:mannose-6-phosphate isomerase-like protein (cupin superfamily)
MNSKNRIFAEMTLEPDCSLGYHVHHGDAEAYYILSGEGEYDDNGVIRTVKAGDVTYTPDGKGHSLENKGSENLVFIALVIYN